MTGITLVGRMDTPGIQQIQTGLTELGMSELLACSLSGNGSESMILQPRVIHSSTTRITEWSGFLRNGDDQCTVRLAADIVFQRHEATKGSASNECAY